MPEVTVQFRNIPDTEAALGWTGGRSIVVDRPDGKAGGMGLGFNGGQLLAMAIGGCFCNVICAMSRMRWGSHCRKSPSR